MSRSLLIVLAVLLHSFLIGQNKFHRGYPFNNDQSPLTPDTSIVHLAGLQMRDGSYLSLDGFSETVFSDSGSVYLVLTAFKPKGDIAQSRKLELKSRARIYNGSASLIQASTDSIYLSFTSLDTTDKRVVMALDKNLDPAWTLSFNGKSPDAAKRLAHLLVEGRDSLLYELVQIDRADSSLWYVNRLDTKGGLNASFKYQHNRANGTVMPAEARDFRVTQDTGWVWTGSVDRTAAGKSAMMVKLDKDLKPVLGRMYLPGGYQYAEGLKIMQIGTTYLIAGRSGNSLNAMDQAFILQADSGGKIIWSKKTDDKISKKTIIDGLIQDKDGSIVVSGKIVLKDTTETPFMLKMNQGGTQSWLVTYPRAKAFFNLQGSLFETGDNGYGYFHTDVDDEMNENLKMGFIKTDDKGISSCEVADTSVLFINHTFAVDSMALVRSPASDTLGKVEINDEGFSGFDVPVLSLADIKFCRNETIDVTYAPKPEGAVAWLWNDGSTNDSLRVFKTGEYSVTVTIDDKYCYMLCDTSNLDYYDLPFAAINRGPQVCINTPYVLSAIGQGGKPGYTYLWQNGDKTPTLQPSVTGTFSVTVTDACMETAKATINVGSDIWLGPPAAAVVPGDKVCENTNFLISASAAGGGGGYTYLWNNGSTEPAITTNVLGTYRVTITDLCGLKDSAEVKIDASIWLPAPTVQLVKGPTVCKDDFFLLSAAGAGGGGNYRYKWNNGDTISIIRVTALGTYSVTVTDRCGKSNSASIVIDASIWNPAPTVEVTASEENSYCQTGLIGLQANAAAFGNNNGIVKYEWSAGNSATSQVIVDGEGKYAVTVTDACGMTATAEYQTGELGIACLRFPRIIFLKDTARVENRVFGAINKCGADSSAVTNFELHIFNRWGKEVFSTTDIEEKWDATLPDSSGKPITPNQDSTYPPEVYVWYVRYSVGAFCKYEGKGDVTVFW